MGYKMLAVVIFGLVMVILVELGFRPAIESPPNRNVNEQVYKLLRKGMTQAEVEHLLGQPHKTLGGVVARLESQESAGFTLVIQERRLAAGRDWVNVYQGPNEESIRVLFSSGSGQVMAIEYRVADLPVLYKGQRSDIAASPVMAATKPVVNPDMENRETILRRYNRVNGLLRGEAAQTGASPTAPVTSADDAPPPPLPKADQLKQGS